MISPMLWWWVSVREGVARAERRIRHRRRPSGTQAADFTPRGGLGMGKSRADTTLPAMPLSLHLGTAVSWHVGRVTR